MSIVFVFSASFCHGAGVAAALGERLGGLMDDQDLIRYASERFGVPSKKFEQVMTGSPPFFNRLTHEHERNLAFLRLALAEKVQDDGWVYHGLAGHLLPRSLSQVLWACLAANHPFRIETAVRELGGSEKDARKAVGRDDAERIRWTQRIHGADPYDKALYDVLLPMHETSVDQAVETLCELASSETVRTSEATVQVAQGFLLAARVHLELARQGHDVEVAVEDGHAFIGINKFVVNLDRHSAKLKALAKQVEGIREVDCKPGTRFVPPSLVGPQDLELPTKVLLVDDEREFVHTLSERLRSRQLASEVVYNGEQALAVIESEPPEVMVLDLKMPGIDGLEVLRRVKESHPKVEVVILTGHGSEQEEQRARELGAFAYLKKPVDIELLAQTMRDAYRKLGKSPPAGSEPSED